MSTGKTVVKAASEVLDEQGANDQMNTGGDSSENSGIGSPPSPDKNVPGKEPSRTPAEDESVSLLERKPANLTTVWWKSDATSTSLHQHPDSPSDCSVDKNLASGSLGPIVSLNGDDEVAKNELLNVVINRNQGDRTTALVGLESSSVTDVAPESQDPDATGDTAASSGQQQVSSMPQSQNATLQISNIGPHVTVPDDIARPHTVIVKEARSTSTEFKQAPLDDVVVPAEGDNTVVPSQSTISSSGNRSTPFMTVMLQLFATRVTFQVSAAVGHHEIGQEPRDLAILAMMGVLALVGRMRNSGDSSFARFLLEFAFACVFMAIITILFILGHAGELWAIVSLFGLLFWMPLVLFRFAVRSGGFSGN
ncbi:hypothetical protein BDV96DRAFT_638445 [Lophiotrema nucula]|uniref:Uncharacterized protein n=1 Tax=Lophiotrema nucula TaxID=690887 RepID=A0A6A5YG52_9PLEO|nr:hypothetical protein BDV96DRAFT_638445 [Lophiotrema nucula]